MRIYSILPHTKESFPEVGSERRFSLIKSYAGPGTEVTAEYPPGDSGFVGWAGVQEFYGKDADVWQRAHQLSLIAARKAEAEGYDAYCPWGTLDFGVLEALETREFKKILIVGQGVSTLLYCKMLGRKFAGCVYQDLECHVRPYEELVDAVGVRDLYVGSTAIGMPNSEYPTHREEVRDRFVRCADEARERGAEIMGLVSMSICPVAWSAAELSEAAGMPVVDAAQVQITTAEWWYRMGFDQSLLAVPRNSVAV